MGCGGFLTGELERRYPCRRTPDQQFPEMGADDLQMAAYKSPLQSPTQPENDWSTATWKIVADLLADRRSALVFRNEVSDLLVCQSCES